MGDGGITEDSHITDDVLNATTGLNLHFPGFTLLGLALTIRVHDGETVGGVEGRGRRAIDGTATGQYLGVWLLCTCDGGEEEGEHLTTTLSTVYSMCRTDKCTR